MFTAFDGLIKISKMEYNHFFFKWLDVEHQSQAIFLTYALQASGMCAPLQVEDLLKENQYLKKTMSKVINMAPTPEVIEDELDYRSCEAYNHCPENSAVDPFFSHTFCLIFLSQNQWMCRQSHLKF